MPGMENPIVRCTVDECTHYMAGNQCAAAKISIFNEQPQSGSGKPADTQCKSFHQRQSFGDMAGALHNFNAGGALAAALVDGAQANPQVECFVDNCRHWYSDNVCNAEQISVVGPGARYPSETDCNTFARR